MKIITSLYTSAFLTLCLLSLSGCESQQLKDGADDVVEVMQNGVDVVTETGNKAADAVQKATDSKN
jgi:hypothetical protein